MKPFRTAFTLVYSYDAHPQRRRTVRNKDAIVGVEQSIKEAPNVLIRHSSQQIEWYPLTLRQILQHWSDDNQQAIVKSHCLVYSMGRVILYSYSTGNAIALLLMALSCPSWSMLMWAIIQTTNPLGRTHYLA